MSCGALAARELPFWRDQLAGPDPSVQIATELDEEHLDPNHPGETRLRQAFRAYERFQYAHARRHFEAYLAAGGEGAYARYILARISAGKTALEHINRSVELAPDESEFSAYRIAVLRRLEQYAPIEDFIHNRLHQFYSSANVELETARYFQQRNQNARALFHYERARSVFDPLIDDSDLLAQALRGAGILRYQRGDFRQARARFEHIPPGSVPIPAAYYQATRIYLSNLQGEPALQILTRLNALPPRYRQRHAAIFEALPAALAVAYYLTDDVRFESAYRHLENPDALIRIMHAEKNGAHDRVLEMLAPVRNVRSFVRNQSDFPSLALLV
ncbi:MAG: hypothetical protein KDK34_03060, partial [Leptospiraceae bacterium]|nr:hypothetical protein [Leptospiraceae bacterium]